MADISNRANEIAFNIGFMREISALQHVQALPDEERGASMTRSPMRLHLISGTETLGEYGISSKLNPQLAFLQHLHDRGVEAADTWLREHGASVGLRSTLDNLPVFFADRV